jgi:quercetin dioxygenase-like cupin family protein
MTLEAAVVSQDACEWETWPAEQVGQRGESEWKTLISAGLTSSAGLTMGVARLPPGGSLRTHRHEQHEAYLVLDGSGIVTIDGAAHPLSQGVAVFIPGGASHSVEATGRSDLQVAYVLAADSFDDVEYVFDA